MLEIPHLLVVLFSFKYSIYKPDEALFKPKYVA